MAINRDIYSETVQSPSEPDYRPEIGSGEELVLPEQRYDYHHHYHPGSVVIVTLRLSSNVAVEFLMGNKFRIEAPFQEGVPYLSRDEEKLAMAKAVERRDRVTVPSDIDVKETDHESLQFLKVVRSGINAWLALGDVDAPL